ncbi:syntaxin-1A [Trichonephila clavipes]|nr:syntaxin-1A [Trichonephila clavipes]
MEYSKLAILTLRPTEPVQASSQAKDFHELDRLMAKIQSYSANTWSLLKAAKQTRQKDSVPRSSIRMETVQLSSLTQKFLDTLADYSAAQTSYRERKKKLLKKQLEITGQEVDEEQLEKMLDENRAVFTQDYIVEVERAREDLTDVKQRYGEVLKIENKLRELDDMLLSLSILINSQLDCKLQVKSYREGYRSRKSARFFSVDELNIRLWRKNKTNFENCDRR